MTVAEFALPRRDDCLIPLWHYADKSKIPAAKSIPVWRTAFSQAGNYPAAADLPRPHIVEDRFRKCIRISRAGGLPDARPLVSLVGSALPTIDD
jgi:hypothetical protein